MSDETNMNRHRPNLEFQGLTPFMAPCGCWPDRLRDLVLCQISPHNEMTIMKWGNGVAWYTLTKLDMRIFYRRRERGRVDHTMANRGLCWLIGMTLFMSMAASQAAQKPIDPRIEAFALDGGRKLELIEGIPESEVIAQLKVIRGRYPEIYPYGNSKALSADEALLRTGDEETILRLMDQYHRGEGHGESVLMAANEKALRFLIEDVRSGSEELRRRATDSWGPSIRIASTTKFLMILKRNADLPEKTRKWADRTQTLVMGGLKPSSDIAIQAVLKWWEKNEVAILEGRYADATWLPEESEGTRPRPKLRPGRGEQQNQVSGVAGNDPGATGGFFSNGESAAGGRTLWIVVAVGIVSVILLLLRLRGFQHKP